MFFYVRTLTIHYYCGIPTHTYNRFHVKFVSATRHSLVLIMAQRTFDDDGLASEDSGYTSYEGCSGYRTGVFDATNRNEPVNRVAVPAVNGHRRMTSIRSNVVNTNSLRSRIPVRTTTAPAYSLNHVSIARYDQMILEIREVLSRLSITAHDQRWLRSIICSLELLRRTAWGALPEDVAELVSRYASPPVYGPQPRPLSEAALRQNAQARVRQCLTASRGEAGQWDLSTPMPTEYLPRYSNPYDDIMGTRSLDDGSAGAYAKRDGDEATYQARFQDGCHNGLDFRRGHLHITTEDRSLVEARQARALASLSTRAMDEEITHRVVRDYDSWGWVGQCLRETEWAEKLRCYCDSVNCGARRHPRVDN